MRSSRHIYGRLGGAHPARIRALSPAAWYQPGVGQTVTGSGVSRWADQALLDGTRDLLQGTDTNRPALQADGSVLFDGTDNFLKVASFSLSQPITIYAVVTQVSWGSTDTLWETSLNGGGGNRITQNGTTPDLKFISNGTSDANANLAVGAKGIITTIGNGVSGYFQINNTTALTGNYGTVGVAGISMGADTPDAGGPFRCANMQLYEWIMFNAAHSAAQRSVVRNYLAARHSVAL